jgi:hypothetical protein
LSAFDMAPVRRDVEALAGMERGSAGAGERASAAWIAERLRDAGAAEVRVQGFRFQRTWAHRQAVHFATGLAAALSGKPRDAALALGALVSFDLDFSGRSQWLSRILPAGEGATVTARVPAQGEPRRTLVLVAHHDTQRSGLMWHPRLLAPLGAERDDRRDAMDSLAALPEIALGLVALGSAFGWRLPRVAGATVLATALALALDVARGQPVPGANDNASGVAAVLALVERLAMETLPGTEVVAVFPGCEEAGMGGMADWIRRESGALDPARTLVVGLDTIGSGDPIVASGEGGLRTERYREEDLAWADRGAELAGLPRPRRFRIGGWTDPVLALFAGLPAISILSVRGGRYTNYHQPTDTPDRVDWGSVERCTRLAAGIAQSWS